MGARESKEEGQILCVKCSRKTREMGLWKDAGSGREEIPGDLRSVLIT